ncbi:MAG: glycosyltransferase family 2 protein [Pseudomonadota bacterium]
MLVSIVNYQSAEPCIRCLESLAEQRADLPALKVVVADGGSPDNSVEILEKWILDQGYAEWISLLPLGLNGGFGWAHNQVMLRALQSEHPPEFVHLLNPDTRLEGQAILALRNAFDRDPEIACVGSQLVNSHGGLQPAGFHFPNIRTELARGARVAILARLMLAPDPVILADEAPQYVPALSGASFMVRVSGLRETGLFDDAFFLYFEEIEWMHRIRQAGWEVLHEPASRVHHIGGVSTKLSRDEGELLQSGRPFYWYQSQRRCLIRTLGTGRAHVAFYLWWLGYVVFAIPLSFVSPIIRRNLIKDELSDARRAWREPSPLDRSTYAPALSDPPGADPAWLSPAKERGL